MEVEEKGRNTAGGRGGGGGGGAFCTTRVAIHAAQELIFRGK